MVTKMLTWGQKSNAWTNWKFQHHLLDSCRHLLRHSNPRTSLEARGSNSPLGIDQWGREVVWEIFLSYIPGVNNSKVNSKWFLRGTQVDEDPAAHSSEKFDTTPLDYFSFLLCPLVLALESFPQINYLHARARLRLDILGKSRLRQSLPLSAFTHFLKKRNFRHWLI